jgi:HSP90 family molecular chaperone
VENSNTRAEAADKTRISQDKQDNPAPKADHGSGMMVEAAKVMVEATQTTHELVKQIAETNAGPKLIATLDGVLKQNKLMAEQNQLLRGLFDGPNKQYRISIEDSDPRSGCAKSYILEEITDRTEH